MLNAGSGGSIYNGISGKFFHVDISDKFIKELPNSYVASIENLPFNTNFFDTAICVGSVINYCNALTALSEIYRVLKHDSYLILEYERSSTGELIFQKDYNKSITLQVYQYNNQDNHKIWLYSDKYINSILKNIGFKLVDNRYYHVFSSLYNHFADDENKSGKIAKLDKIAATFVKKYLAHNRIMTCYKE